MLKWSSWPCMWLFFFSSRRRHTRCLSDWSSDVCSSDLDIDPFNQQPQGEQQFTPECKDGKVRAVIGEQKRGKALYQIPHAADDQQDAEYFGQEPRSEERRVGKECRSRWPKAQCNKKGQH